MPLPTSPHGRDRDRNKRRAKGGRAGFRNRAPGGISEHREGGDIGRLALIGRHALCGVAFHMLDAAEIFLRGQLDVFDVHVVLKIEPFPPLTRHMPKGFDVVGAIFGTWHPDAPIGRQANVGAGLFARRSALNQTIQGGHRPIGSPGCDHAGHRAGSAGGARHKALQRVVPDRPPVHVTCKVNRWVPATGHRKAICGDLLFAAAM